MTAQRVMEHTCEDCGYLFDAIGGMADECPKCKSANVRYEIIKNDHEGLHSETSQEKEILSFICSSCRQKGEAFFKLPERCPFCETKNSLQRKSIKSN